MSEKKNIVIKVKYPTSGQSDPKPGPNPRLITEWNYKRIGIVAVVLAIIATVLPRFVNDDSPAPEKPATAQSIPLPIPKQPVEQTKTEVTAEKPVQPAKPALEIDKLVARSILTRGIEKNEPIDSITPPIKIGRKETLGLYYFVELRNMKGKAIFHEWLLNGELVSSKKVNISSDPWRTASKQVINYTMDNDWTVRLMDESGAILNEKRFNLELK